MEKLLPHNIEAERGVLGSIIIDPEAITQIADTLSADDFYRDAHRTIYRAVQDIHRRHEAADFITICDELERRNKLEDVGGASYITSLINQVPTSGNIEYYGRIVERTAVSRGLIHAAGEIAALACAEADADAALDKAEQLLFGLRSRTSSANGFRPLASFVQEYMTHLDYLYAHRQELPGVSTGYRALDALTAGLQRGDLVILAGRPGSGKTALAVTMARAAALAQKRVAVFSLEMSGRQLVNRLMSIETGIDSSRLRRGWIDDDEWDRVTAAMGRLSEMGIAINDASGNPIAAMRAGLRRLHAEMGGIDLVIVDYLQLIDSAEDARQRENREKEIAAISRGLKVLAREFDVPVLALAQLSRKVEERANKRPILSDLRDSGAIEQDSDIVLFLYRDDYYAKQENRESTAPGLAELNVAKNRNGDVGPVTLRFHAAQTTFTSIEQEEVAR